MKSGIFFIALFAALAFASGIGAEEALSPGLGGLTLPQGHERDTGQDEKNHHDIRNGEGSPSKDRKDATPGEPSPKKKPRLKYRDMFECPC